MVPQSYFFSPFSLAAAFCTAAIFSGRFMRFHLRISSFDRPQLTQRSPFNWQSEIQGFSICEAIDELPVGLSRSVRMPAASVASTHISHSKDICGQVSWSGSSRS